MRIARGVVWTVLNAMLLSACVSARGADGAAGSTGRSSYPWAVDVSSGNAKGPEFQNVMVIAPEAGARCRTSGMARPPGTQREVVANERREATLQIKQSAKAPTITCAKDGETWRRQIERQVVHHVPEKTIEWTPESGAPRPVSLDARTLYGFQPIVHVPGPDADARARWDAWEAAACAEPGDAMVHFICAEGLARVRAADLGGGG